MIEKHLSDENSVSDTIAVQVIKALGPRAIPRLIFKDRRCALPVVALTPRLVNFSNHSKLCGFDGLARISPEMGVERHKS